MANCLCCKSLFKCFFSDPLRPQTDQIISTNDAPEPPTSVTSAAPAHALISKDPISSGCTDNAYDVDHDQPYLRNFPRLETNQQITLAVVQQLVSFLRDKIQKIDRRASTSQEAAAVVSPTLHSRHKVKLQQYMTSLPKSQGFALGNTCMSLLEQGLQGLGNAHWAFTALSLVGWAMDTYETYSENKEAAWQLLEDVIDINDKVIRVWEATSMVTNSTNPNSNEQRMLECLQETAGVALECALYGLSLMEEQKQYRNKILGFLGAKDGKAAMDGMRGRLESARQKVRDELAISTYSNTSGPARQITYTPDPEIVGDATFQLVQSVIRRLSSPMTAAVLLHGMGGIGKSTIATDVFARFQKDERYVFCRIQLTLTAEEDEIRKKQKEMLDIVCSFGNNREPSSLGDGRKMLEGALQKLRNSKEPRPVFLYVDNLEKKYSENWIPKASCFPDGSKVLVTSRNNGTCLHLVTQQLMLQLEDYTMMTVEKLQKEAARRLLRKFVKRRPWEEGWVDKLEDEVLAKCDGLPLALKVVGSHIAVEYEELLSIEGSEPKAGVASAKEVWESVVKQMAMARPLDGEEKDELYFRLRFSIDTLHEHVKSAFFDLVHVLANARIYSPLNDSSCVERLVTRDQAKLLHKRSLVSWLPTGVVVHDVMKALGRRLMAADDRWLRLNGSPVDETTPELLPKVVGLCNARDPPLRFMPHLRYMVNVVITETSSSLLPPSLVLAYDIRVDAEDVTLDFSRSRNLRVLGLNGVKVTTKMAGCWRFLTELRLSNCEDLICVPDAAAGWTSLTRLELSGCNKLESISDGAAAGWRNLTMLTLCACGELIGIPDGAAAWTSLTHLYLIGCDKLERISASAAAAWYNVKFLWVLDCRALSSLPIRNLREVLFVEVSGCPLLTQLQVPQKIKRQPFVYLPPAIF